MPVYAAHIFSVYSSISTTMAMEKTKLVGLLSILDMDVLCLHLYIIRILNGCEIKTENYFTRVTVQHHKACLLIPNRYLE